MWKTKQVLALHALISLQDGITINAKMINVCIQKLYVFATDSSAITDYRIKFFFSHRWLIQGKLSFVFTGA